MNHSISRRIAAVVTTGLLLTGLAACGGEDTDSQDSGAPASTSPASQEPTEGTTEPAGDGSAPAWAKSSTTTEGTKISSFKVGDVNVDVFQVGVETATKTGSFVNPDNNKPIIAEGAEIVYLNYVITNEGDTINLGSSLVNIDPKYDDWPYLQGMDSVVDLAQFEKLGIVNGPSAEYTDPPVYPFEKGQTISYGTNFLYEKGGKIAFTGTYTPVDDAGELLHDDRTEGEGTGTIE